MKLIIGVLQSWRANVCHLKLNFQSWGFILELSINKLIVFNKYLQNDSDVYESTRVNIIIREVNSVYMY